MFSQINRVLYTRNADAVPTFSCFLALQRLWRLLLLPILQQAYIGQFCDQCHLGRLPNQERVHTTCIKSSPRWHDRGQEQSEEMLPNTASEAMGKELGDDHGDGMEDDDLG